MDAWIKKVGTHRGRPRIFLDGIQAARAGFAPGETFDVEVDGQRVSLVKKDDGSRVVSSRNQNGAVKPVIDINSAELLSMFEGMDCIRVIVAANGVYFLPLASEVKRVERLDRLRTKVRQAQPLQIGSLSHGGGVLTHAIHQGMQEAGLECTLAMANEIREDLLVQAIEHNDAWNDATSALALPMQELVQDDWLMSKLPQLECLEMGLPCSGASKAGKAKKGLEMMEAHEHVGHLVAAAIAIINRTQPTVVLLENVVDYSTSASAFILRHTLRDMGYDVHEAVLSGRDFGCFENRIRWALVAVTRGMAFDMKDLAPPVALVRRVDDILDKSIALDDPRWRAVEYLKDKRERDEAKGSGFKMQYVDPEATTLPVLRKGYHKGGSTDPRLRHPENAELSRLLTKEEHEGIPPEIVEGLSETLAHQLLGQSIAYVPFQLLGARIGQCVMKFAAEEESLEMERDSSRPRVCG